jgi:hypothetical protein
MRTDSVATGHTQWAGRKDHLSLETSVLRDKLFVSSCHIELNRGRTLKNGVPRIANETRPVGLLYCERTEDKE